MKKEDFHMLIDDSVKSFEHKEELGNLKDKYPWFEHARSLYSKALKQTNDESFEEELLLTSIYSSNRKRLFDLVMSDPEAAMQKIKKKILPQSELIISEKTTELPLESAKNQQVIQEIKEKEEVEPVKTVEIKEDLPEDVLDQDLNSNVESKPEEVQSISSEESSVKEKSDNPILEKQILEGAVSRIIEKEANDELFKIAGPIEEIHQDVIDPKEQESSYSDYTNWILNRAKEMQYQVNLSPEKNRNPDEIAEFKLDADLPIVSDKKQKVKLIDAFIAKDPKITPGKVESYDTIDLAKASLKSSDDFLTETMAEIYIKQGKMNKAKQAFKLLSLKYPEKSIYFAARIKNLDKNSEK